MENRNGNGAPKQSRTEKILRSGQAPGAAAAAVDPGATPRDKLQTSARKKTAREADAENPVAADHLSGDALDDYFDYRSHTEPVGQDAPDLDDSARAPKDASTEVRPKATKTKTHEEYKSQGAKKGKSKDKAGGRKAAPPGKPPSAHWQRSLATTKKGTFSATLANAISILKHDPTWAGVLAYDEFSARIMKISTPNWHAEDRPSKRFCKPGPWTDVDVTFLRSWFQREYEMRLRSSDVVAAVEAVSRANPKHGPRDWLRSLRGKWDGVKRLDGWLVDYGGAENTRYVRAVSAKWMISAVARAFNPGCKVDYTLILEGDQGIGKSTLLQTIAHDEAWLLIDLGGELGSKDSYQALRGKWIVEMAELDSLSRGKLSRVKAFLTSQMDTYRKSYGRETEDFPRCAVFSGTTNKDEYLRDETGNRRFWPVKVTKIDISGAEAVHPQLWAEAVERYFGGEAWHITDEKVLRAAAAQQRSRLESDPLDVKVASYLMSHPSKCKKGISTHDILADVFKNRTSDRGDEMRVADALRRLGWEKDPRQFTIGGARVRLFFPRSDMAEPPAVAAKTRDGIASTRKGRK